MNRREFLLTSLMALLMPNPLKSIGKSSFLEIAVVKYKGKYNQRNSGIKKFLWEASKRTSIEISFQVKEISLENKKELFRHPLLFMVGDQAVSLNKKEIKHLKNFLNFGGILFIDSFSEEENDPFLESIENLLEKIYPNKRIKTIPRDHVLYRTFNLLDKPYGRLPNTNNLYTINTEQAPLKIILSKNDILGAITIDKLGSWKYPVVNEQIREMAFRTMINIMMYATCLDYKADQVHVDYLLKTRR